MAGCLPEYLPVVIAAVEAICEPRFNLYGVQATTGYVGPALMLNGPIRKQLNVNCDAGVFGPGFRSNATIGRAIRLILITVGGGFPGDTDRSTFGWPGKYTMCFGENQEKSPWEPYHVEMGFKPEESTVTVFGINGFLADSHGRQSGRAGSVIIGRSDRYAPWRESSRCRQLWRRNADGGARHRRRRDHGAGWDHQKASQSSISGSIRHGRRHRDRRLRSPRSPPAACSTRSTGSSRSRAPAPRAPPTRATACSSTTPATRREHRLRRRAHDRAASA